MSLSWEYFAITQRFINDFALFLNNIRIYLRKCGPYFTSLREKCGRVWFTAGALARTEINLKLARYYRHEQALRVAHTPVGSGRRWDLCWCLWCDHSFSEVREVIFNYSEATNKNRRNITNYNSLQYWLVIWLKLINEQNNLKLPHQTESRFPFLWTKL